LTIRVDKNRIPSALVDPVNAGDERACLNRETYLRVIPNAKSAGLAANTSVANIDIARARSEILASTSAQGYVVVACAV
jgi:hypothetical protein